MAKRELQEVRDRILGKLYPHYKQGLTFDVVRSETGLDIGTAWTELHHLIDKGHVEQRVDPAFVAGGNIPIPGGSSTTGRIFDITAAGREYLEGKGGINKQGSGQARSASLKRIPANLAQAESWLDAASRAASRANELATHDYPGSAAAAQEGIELAAKALFYMAGFEHPEDHAVGDRLMEVVKEVVGEDLEAKYTRAYIARVAWLNTVSEPLHQVARYGSLSVPAKEVIDSTDAQVWKSYAEQAVQRANQIYWWAKGGKVRFS